MDISADINGRSRSCFSIPFLSDSDLQCSVYPMYPYLPNNGFCYLVRPTVAPSTCRKRGQLL